MSKFMLFTRIKGPFSQKPMKCGEVNRKLKAVSNCWICEGWSEVEFAVKPG